MCSYTQVVIVTHIGPVIPCQRHMFRSSQVIFLFFLFSFIQLVDFCHYCASLRCFDARKTLVNPSSSTIWIVYSFLQSIRTFQRSQSSCQIYPAAKISLIHGPNNQRAWYGFTKTPLASFSGCGLGVLEKFTVSFSHLLLAMCVFSIVLWLPYPGHKLHGVWVKEFPQFRDFFHYSGPELWAQNIHCQVENSATSHS